MESKQLSSTGFILGEVENIPEYYVDGITSSFLGSPVSKITFHSVKELTDEGKEVRNPRVRLVIQTGALVEFCRTILAIGTANTEALQSGFEQNKAQLGLLLQGIEVPLFVPPQESQ